MKGYRYDLHVHTSEGSACASSTGAEMAAAAAAAGYAGLVITDHFFNGNTAVPRNLPWGERVQGLTAGYRHAREAGERLGLTVLLGWEYGWYGSDFLTLGLPADWLLAYPDVLDWQLEDYLKVVRSDGGYVVHAHPFREAWYVSQMRLLPYAVDAVEVINTSHQNPDFNRRARWYAEEFHLTQVSGSDAHGTDWLKGGVILPERVNDSAELIAGLRDGRATLYEADTTEA